MLQAREPDVTAQEAQRLSHVRTFYPDGSAQLGCVVNPAPSSHNPASQAGRERRERKSRMRNGFGQRRYRPWYRDVHVQVPGTSLYCRPVDESTVRKGATSTSIGSISFSWEMPKTDQCRIGEAVMNPPYRIWDFVIVQWLTCALSMWLPTQAAFQLKPTRHETVRC